MLFPHKSNCRLFQRKGKEKVRKKYGVIPSVTKLNCLILSLEFPFKVRVIELTRQHCIVFSHWWPCFPFTAFWFTTLFFFLLISCSSLPLAWPKRYKA